MRIKRVFLVCSLFLFFSYGIVHAGDLIAKEAARYFDEGLEAQRSRNYEEANAAFGKAMLVDPYNIKWRRAALNNQGIICLEQGDYESAEAVFLEAIKADPDFKTAQINLGLVYNKTKSRAEALEYWAKVFEVDTMKPQLFIPQEEPAAAKNKK